MTDKYQHFWEVLKELLTRDYCLNGFTLTLKDGRTVEIKIVDTGQKTEHFYES